MPPTPSTPNNPNVAAAYNANTMHAQNNTLQPSAYANVPGSAYPGAGVNSAMYNPQSGAIRPKTNHVGK